MGKDTASRVARVRERDGDSCCFCQRPIDFDAKPPRRWAPTIHHDPPKRDGGTNALTDLKLAHARCHRKHHLDDSLVPATRDGLLEVTPGRERLGL